MIIVLEGPDGVGKTTLADAIESLHSGTTRRINEGPPPSDVPPYLYYSCMLDDTVTSFRDTVDHLVIIDRFHVGELIYAPMFRGTRDLSIDEAKRLDVELVKAGATLIHCWLPTKEMHRRQIQRDGGKPDEKSGAALKHAPAIKAAFSWACGDNKRDGALTPMWNTVDMRGYPDQLADKVYSMVVEAAKMEVIKLTR